MQEQPTKIETFAIIEIMGNKKLAGKATTEVFGSSVMLRVDVPSTTSSQPYTQYFGMSSIYCITPVNQETALKMAESLKAMPPITWELQQEINIKADNLADSRQKLISQSPNFLSDL